MAESEGLRGDELEVLILFAIPSLDSSAEVFGVKDSSIGASDAMALWVSPQSSVLRERGETGRGLGVSFCGIGIESDIVDMNVIRLEIEIFYAWPMCTWKECWGMRWEITKILLLGVENHVD